MVADPQGGACAGRLATSLPRKRLAFVARENRCPFFRIMRLGAPKAIKNNRSGQVRETGPETKPQFGF
jgi:hypothetical protein